MLIYRYRINRRYGPRHLVNGMRGSVITVGSNPPDEPTERPTLLQRVKWFFGMQPRPLALLDRTIRWRSVVCHHGEPLRCNLLLLTYLRIAKLYNKDKDIHGFCNIFSYLDFEDPSQMTEEVRSEMKRLNPCNKDCVNIVYEKVNQSATRSTGHIVLTHFLSKEGTVKVFDGTEYVRKQPIEHYLRSVIIAQHGHVPGTLRAGFSQEYSVQKDLWTCSYRAVFSCLAILYNQRPEDFEVKIDEMFLVVKWLVEADGKELKKRSLKKLWKFVSTKKNRKIQDTVNWEVLKEN